MKIKRTLYFLAFFIMLSIRPTVTLAGDSVHFTPVEETGDPQAAIIQNATMNGQPLQNGDEVGIFDDSLCVGAASFDGTFPWVVSVWKQVSIPGGGKSPGGRPDKPMRFVLWQKNTDFEGMGTPNFESGSNGVFNEALTVLTLLEGHNHFVYSANTGHNSTVIVPDAIVPNIEGVPLVFGDEIGVFTPSGLCVGAVIWTLGDVEIKVWGNDEQTPEVDGIMTGEVMNFRLWDISAGLGYYTEITYASGPETYIQNSTSTLNKLKGVPPPYPVELTSFKAIIQNNNILLNWQTATETNNFGFEVQRQSKDRWELVDFVNGNGTTTEPQHYEFIDYLESIPMDENTLAYRLKQIDTDGTFTYSKIVKVTRQLLPRQIELAQNYPNPFNPTTKISYSLAAPARVSLRLFDALGREISVLVDEFMPAGNYTVPVDLNGLPSGIYFYKIHVGNFIASKKMSFLR